MSRRSLLLRRRGQLAMVSRVYDAREYAARERHARAAREAQQAEATARHAAHILDRAVEDWRAAVAGPNPDPNHIRALAAATLGGETEAKVAAARLRITGQRLETASRTWQAAISAKENSINNHLDCKTRLLRFDESVEIEKVESVSIMMTPGRPARL